MTIFTIINTHRDDGDIRDVTGSFTERAAAESWIARNTTPEVEHLRQCCGLFEILELPLDDVPDIEVITEEEYQRRKDETREWHAKLAAKWRAEARDYRDRSEAGEDVSAHAMHPFRKMLHHMISP